MKITSFATDKKAEVEGVWMDIGEGAELRLARAGNPKYIQYVRALSKPHRARIARRNLPDDIGDKIVIKALARFVLLDWKGIVDEEGAVVEYSEEKAIEFLTDYPDFRELVSDLSSDIATFQIDDETEAIEEIKNT